MIAISKHWTMRTPIGKDLSLYFCFHYFLLRSHLLKGGERVQAL